MYRSPQSRKHLALSATRFASRFLDASCKGAALLESVERVWSHLSMEVYYRQIEPFDVTNIDEVNRNLLRRGMLLRSYPSAVVARWKRYVHPAQFRVYFFDDLQSNPAELRRSILCFL